jgi:hypothetical protein
MPVFDRLRYRRQDAAVFLFAFDLLEFEGRGAASRPARPPSASPGLNRPAATIDA